MKPPHRLVIALVLFGGIAGCSSRTARVEPRAPQARLFDGMGTHQREVTTDSQKAQQFFDQGFVWMYAFNHDEAIRSFEAATRHDPECAMAWWGIALANGPHINNPVLPPDRAKAANEALERAVALRDRCTPVERALIDALTQRYDDPPPDDRAHLDKAYADAMARVWREFPNDADVGTLYAEAIMDLHPWNLWTQDGQPKADTVHIVATLEQVLRIDPNNPGANHLYIHAVEASSEPARANAAADRLRESVPASSHLTHMPSHIDVLTGRWAKASEQNERAIEIDRRYEKLSPRQDFYRLYMIHNRHMLSFAAMMEGRSEVSIKAAHDMVNSLPEKYVRENAAFVDPYMGAEIDALKRFGKWDELIAYPEPPEHLPITRAMWRFNRGLAYAAKHEVDKAKQERAAFLRARAAIPEDATFAINPAHDIMRIAEHMLDGEIALARGETDASVAALRKAVELEDSLLYMEPPEWVQPVRHTLGAVLLDAGRYEEAEAVYRKDLKKWPNNGWSLYGLSRSLHSSDSRREVAELQQQFKKVWSRADITIGSSCLCVPAT